jgi:hypothetical protein
MSVIAFTAFAFLLALADLAPWAVRHRSEPATSAAVSDGPAPLGNPPRLRPDAHPQPAAEHLDKIGQTRPPGAVRDLRARHGARNRAPARRASPAPGPGARRKLQSDTRPRRPLGRGRYGEGGPHD